MLSTILKNSVISFAVFAGFLFLVVIFSFIIQFLLRDANEIMDRFGAAIFIGFWGLSLIAYLVVLYYILKCNLWALMAYGFLPIVTALIIFYLIIKNIRLGW